MLTFEDMKDIAAKVAEALAKAPGVNDVAVLADDVTPGDPIPIAFTYPDADGDPLDFALALDTL